MAATFSLALVNTMMGKTLVAAYAAGGAEFTDGASFKKCMTGGFLDVFGGVRPATPETVESGTRLVRLYNNAPTYTTGLNWEASANLTLGKIEKLESEVWQGLVTLAGTATWFRFYSAVSGDCAGGASVNYCRFDGSVGTSPTNDLVLTATGLVVGVPIIVASFSVTLPVA